MSVPPETAHYTVATKAGDDIMTVKEFNEYCDEHGFVDGDGFGLPAKEAAGKIRTPKFDMKNGITPSNRADMIPKDATHIVWFNK